MDERTVQFRVGVMVLATLIILAILLLLFGDLPSLVKGTYTVHFAFPQAPGVSVDTPVRVNGILIGRVREVQLDDKVGVLVSAKIEEKYNLYKNQMGKIGGSLLGDAVIEIVADPEPKPRDKVRDGDTMSGIVAKDPFQALTNLEGQVSIAVTSIDKAAKSLTTTSEEIGSLAARANKFLSTNDTQISTIIADTHATIVQLRTAIANADAFINDPVMKQNLQKTVNEMPVVLNQLTETIGGLKTTMMAADRNLNNLEGITKPLGERGPALIASVDRAAKQLDTVLTELSGFTRQLTSSQGTFSKLVNDTALYDSVSQTVNNVNELSRDLKPIIADVRVFSDKIARHPELLGARGAIQGSNGLKDPPGAREWTKQGIQPSFPPIIEGFQR
jgi:phospholipid/cholesterol/gamma-HCH transport system substrate-binding protein